MILSSYTLNETSRVLKEKFPSRMAEWDYMLSNSDFELAYTPNDFSTLNIPYIRDPEDIPILASAIIAEPDFFITGDKDFHTREIHEYLSIIFTG